MEQEKIREYLDKCIRFWRKRREDSKNNNIEKIKAECYIDAFQSVRVTLFGYSLPMEKTDK
jgi:hypothetical protein